MKERFANYISAKCPDNNKPAPKIKRPKVFFVEACCGSDALASFNQLVLQKCKVIMVSINIAKNREL